MPPWLQWTLIIAGLLAIALLVAFIGRQSRARRAKVCQFCVEKIDYIDYKKPELLLPYISPYGKMLSRRRTGVCAKHQRRLAIAIKRARFLALLPYTAEHIRRYGS
jgi:small subunit ribosomal protein S18